MDKVGEPTRHQRGASNEAPFSVCSQTLTAAACVICSGTLIHQLNTLRIRESSKTLIEREGQEIPRNLLDPREAGEYKRASNQ